MFSHLVLILFFSFICIDVLSARNSYGKSKSHLLSRHKRYVAFPDGSSISAAGCVTVGLIGQPAPMTTPGVFTWGLNWGIAYELPNITEVVLIHNLKNDRTRTHMAQRKHRRELYGKLENILNDMGYSGRECILKTLCETGQRVMPGGKNMIEEMFRTLFTFPPTKVLPIEPLEHSIYDAAQRLGSVIDSCARFKCPISLIDLMKGYYDAPSPNVDAGLNPWSVYRTSYG